VEASGRFDIPCKEGAYTMVVLLNDGNGHEQVVSRKHVTVQDGEVTTVRIRLDPGVELGS
jgi:hypothetical protein